MCCGWVHLTKVWEWRWANRVAWSIYGMANGGPGEAYFRSIVDTTGARSELGSSENHSSQIQRLSRQLIFRAKWTKLKKTHQYPSFSLNLPELEQMWPTLNANFEVKKTPIEEKSARKNLLTQTLRVVKKLASVLIAGFKKFNKKYPNEPTLWNHVEMNQL